MIPAIGKNPDVNTLKSRLPGGRAFMPSVSLKRLTKVWQEEPAGKTKQVLEACHRRKEGRSIRGTAREMGLAYSTVRDWLVRMHAGGLNRRFERRRAGRKRTLTGLVFLPPYTPQLNPIEMQWAVLKRLLSGRYFRSVEKLKKTIITLVDNGEMKPVRLMSYLTP